MQIFRFIALWVSVSLSAASSYGAQKRHLTLAPELHQECSRCAEGEEKALDSAGRELTVALEDLPFTSINQPIRGLEDPFVDGFTKSFLMRTELLVGDERTKQKAKNWFSALFKNYPYLSQDWPQDRTAIEDFEELATEAVNLFLDLAATPKYRSQSRLGDLNLAKKLAKDPKNEFLYSAFLDRYAISVRNEFFIKHIVQMLKDIEPGETLLLARFGIEHLPGVYEGVVKLAKAQSLDISVRVDPDFLGHDHSEAMSHFSPRLRKRIKSLEPFIREHETET